ncbi:endo-1,4-beta-xylanase [Streptomyces sp. NBC_00841]|uniref:endo-1,4-beta-xylanase n=1 Tax=unclassified Streptomyces TaxID=2593676 RepID=UPI00224EF992|nr:MULTISPECIES: endo-1,4-beta-xylanase [unclassified Streptomyces]MCX4536807.1 endo-1,4-beta-xylanase [Streptomyces sp. NBC_01669]WRZ97934.1 endo-1,4-beta-xylanase [Streptomyces sp. NBC_00841]
MRKANRAAVVGTAAAALLVSTFTVAASATPENAAQHTKPKSDAAAKTLGALGKRADLRIGTAVDMSALASDAPYRAEAAGEFSSVTPENVMKWEAVEPQRGTYDWAAADKLVDFAKENGQLVRGHTLVWHSQLPAWLNSGDFTADELRDILHQHITDQVTHFKGKIWQWDVVNEAFNDDGTMRNSIWLQKLGPGYIADAFRWAHQADPKAKLFINDYNIEGVNAKSTALYNLVAQLRKEHVPVHGVGIQGHLDVQYSAPHDIATNMKRFDDLGLETAITEADVRIPMPVDNTKLEAQAEAYDVLLRGCLLTEHCTDFTVWGFTDKYSWVPGVFKGEGAANILDENFKAKAAYNAMSADLTLAAGRD